MILNNLFSSNGNTKKKKLQAEKYLAIIKSSIFILFLAEQAANVVGHFLEKKIQSRHVVE
jgi:hypothetical protein